MRRPRVILADDHTMIVDGLRSLLRDHVDLVATVADGEALLEAARRLQPDVVITDISMPKLSGLEVLRRLTSNGAASVRTAVPRFVILTMHADPELAAEALRAGACGYLLKHSAGEELVVAIREVLQGRSYLTPLITKDVVSSLTRSPARARRRGLTARQREVLRLIAAGKRMKEIGAQLQLSRRTVEMHKYEMMQAIGVKTTAELIQYFVRHEELMDDGARGATALDRVR
ncbi:MAG TPA: response regulator transcription factor [Gemmatimonadaceae bacterium]|nr:response regulator transcription factor [Gemmatimonadaceae bacterium]